MSGPAKFLLTTVGGGILLGVAGGYLADPEMQQRGGSEPWRQMLESDQSSSDSELALETPPYDLRPYGGSHSYAPEFADDAIETGSDPYLDADWLEYEADWPEPPQIARLEIEEPEAPSYGRSADFPPPSIDGTANRAERAANEASLAAAAEPADLPPEPRIAQGALPAIW
jgi:hypothetical protein